MSFGRAFFFTSATPADASGAVKEAAAPDAITDADIALGLVSARRAPSWRDAFAWLRHASW